MNPFIHQHKRKIMVGGIIIACVLLTALRWVITYSPPKKRAHQGSSPDEAQAANAAPAVKAFVCKKANFVDNLVMTGTLQGGARVELRFNREGKIAKINARVGDSVRKGSVIAELDVKEAKIRLEQSESELSQAVELYRSGAIAMPRLTQAQLAAQLAREEYQRSFITASRDGAISEMNAEVGEYVNTQMTVAALVSAGCVYVEMGVIEKDLGKLHLGQTVDVEVETYPGVLFKGKIASIAPIVEGTSRTRTVRAELPNEKGVLLPGMFARASIFIMEKPGTMVVPATALKNIKDGYEVFLLEGQRLKAVPVKVGYESADYAEITSGLNEGAKVVSQVTDRIRDGLNVDVIEELSYEDKNTSKNL